MRTYLCAAIGILALAGVCVAAEGECFVFKDARHAFVPGEPPPVGSRGVWRFQSCAPDAKERKAEGHSLHCTLPEKGKAEASVTLPPYNGRHSSIWRNYRCTFWTKTRGASGELTLRFLKKQPTAAREEKKFTLPADADWRRYRFFTDVFAEMVSGEFSIAFDGRGDVWIDCIELLPELMIPITDGLEEVFKLPKTGWKFCKDPQNVGRKQAWYRPAHPDKDWVDMVIEDWWDNHGFKRYENYGWFRRKIEIPASLKRRKIYLYFEGTDEDAWVWVNGEFVGQQFGYCVPFKVDITGAARTGSKDNLVAIRIHNYTLAGGVEKAVHLMVEEQGR